MQDLKKIGKEHYLSTLAASAPQTVLYAFVLALTLDTFHMIEHVAQVYQHAILGLSFGASQGILFFLDFEWNHFTFNSFYLFFLTIIYFKCGFYNRNGPAAEKKFAFWAFNVAFFLQIYHVFEHILRIVQQYQTGCEPCRGFLGYYVDPVYLHATFNTIAYVPALAAFISFGFLARIRFSGRDRAVRVIAVVVIATLLTLNIGGVVGTTSNIAPFPGYHVTTVRQLPSATPPLKWSGPATTFVHLHGLLASPENSSVLYVATHTGLVVGINSSDFKYQWFYLNNERLDLTGMILDPQHPFVIYTFGHPNANDETGIRLSYDRGQSWTQLTTRPDPHQWAVSQSNASVMYATDFPTNVLVKSSDGGYDWKILSSPANVLSIAISPSSPDQLLVGTDRGLFISQDGGLTWLLLSSQFVQARISAVAYDPSNPQVIYVGSFFGMMKSVDGGKSWTSIQNGVSVSDSVQYISVDPRNTNVIYAGAAPGAKIYKSIDGGVDWTMIRAGDQ